MVNIVAPWARELSASTAEYLPRYFMSDPKPGEKFHIDIAPSYDFAELWRLFTETIGNDQSLLAARQRARPQVFD